MDTSFGENGIARTPAGPGTIGDFVAPEESGLAVQADGGILTVGRVAGDAVVLRTTPDGEFDFSFGTGGVASVDLGSDIDYFHSVAVQPDGKIVAVGTKRLNPFGDGDGAVLARFLPDGTLDADFGEGGLVLEPGTPESDTPDAFWHVAVRPDGRIITAGVRGAFFTLEAERYACYATQYLPDGSRDPAFGTDGLVRISPEDDLFCLDGDLMDDGRYVLGIVMEEGAFGPPSVWGAARVLSDGTLDGGFGEGGLALTESLFSMNQGVVAGADGSVTLAGWINAEDAGATLFRFNDNGTPDASFGTDFDTDGLLDLFPMLDESVALQLAMQPDGKVLVTGIGTPEGIPGPYIMRILPDGSPDTSFGNTAVDGTTFLDVSEISLGGSGVGYDVGFDAEGRILMSGDASFDVFPRRGFVARFENDLPFASFFSDRDAFETAYPDLPVEGFEDVNAPPGSGCFGPSPVTSETDNVCFSAGDIPEGLTLAAQGPNQNSPDAMFAAGAGAFDNTSIAVTPAFSSDAFALEFDPGVEAVGFNSFSFGGEVQVARVYDTEGVLIGSTSYVGSDWDPVFVGISAEGGLIGSIVLNDQNDSPDIPSPFVDDLAFSVPAVSTEPSALPERLTLAAPYPNPTRAAATLEFVLSEATDVWLTLYDVLGREVAVVAEGTRGAGVHTAALDTAQLASGLYIVRLTAGEETATRRLTVVR